MGCVMEARGRFKSMNTVGTIEVTFELDDDTDLDKVANLINKELDITAKVHREKRSLDANAYMWVLCEKIAQKIQSTKEEVYRKAIRQVGVFEIVPIRKDAVERFAECWEHNGTGWVCDNLGESKMDGYIKIATYFGSSTYNTKEMARLVDYIVEDAKEQDIEVLPPNELQSLKDNWGI